MAAGAGKQRLYVIPSLDWLLSGKAGSRVLTTTNFLKD
jgi:hypothetical protein